MVGTRRTRCTTPPPRPTTSHASPPSSPSSRNANPRRRAKRTRHEDPEDDMAMPIDEEVVSRPSSGEKENKRLREADEDEEPREVKSLTPPDRVRARRVAPILAPGRKTKIFPISAGSKIPRPTRCPSPTPFLPSAPTPATSPETHTTPTKRIASAPSAEEPVETPTKPFGNIFTHAKHALKLSSSSSASATAWEAPVGRDKERDALQTFLNSRYPDLLPSPDAEVTQEGSKKRPKRSLYVSGPPGTGKTHLVTTHLLHRHSPWRLALESRDVKVVMINCVGLGAGASAGVEDEVWKRVGEAVGVAGKVKAGGWKSAVKDHVASPKSRPCLVILDEVDHLLSTKRTASSDASVLTSFYALSHASADASFTVVGIANALDLSARIKLSAPETDEDDDGDGDEPETSDDAGLELLHFSPYSADEMAAVATQRLARLHPFYTTTETGAPVAQENDVPLFMPPALRLCATRVANVTGDVRTFLSILRRAIDTLEASTRSKLPPTPASTPTKSGAAESDPRLATYTPQTAPKVSPSDIIKLFRTTPLTTASPEVECATRIAALNLHQRLALVSLCVAWGRLASPGAVVSKKDGFAVYRECLKGGEVGIKPVGESEWLDVVNSGLGAQGLVKCTQSAPSNSPPSAKAASAGMKRSPSAMRTWHADQAFSPSFNLSALIPALLQPSRAVDEGGASAGSGEVARMVTTVWEREEKRRRKEARRKQREEERKKEAAAAPREGWDGKGLDGKERDLVGERSKAGRAADEERWE